MISAEAAAVWGGAGVSGPWSVSIKLFRAGLRSPGVLKVGWAGRGVVSPDLEGPMSSYTSPCDGRKPFVLWHQKDVLRHMG